jgi:starch synthase (maltosyl-transferring)
MSTLPPADHRTLPAEGRQRVVIEHLQPSVDGGRFPIKRVTGERVAVEVDAFADGHDRIAGVLRYRHESDLSWQEVPLIPKGNDRWHAEFEVTRLGRYRYTAAAWIDAFSTWQHDLQRRPPEDSDLDLIYRIGAELVDRAAAHATDTEAKQLTTSAELLRSKVPEAMKRTAGLDTALTRLMERHGERHFMTDASQELIVVVDPERARHGAWYEFFPRSCGSGEHGRFADCEPLLAYVAAMGFDVVYVPPIHPIGTTYRKGGNNTLVPTPDDVGSPWAIGGPDGGHTAIHKALGTLTDFRKFVQMAKQHGLDVALDLAYQCSPDHPYIKEHPEWFRRRPDGSIQYAENPPKKYQDIYPFDFESEAWPGLWQELNAVVRFWIDQGVRIFRVDNPHTKAFGFWEWLINDIKRDAPEVIFLAEAFTRPKVMHRLAKLGFTQSYTYFTWRNTKGELIEYFTELNQHFGREYFRPSIWPNTPDILHEYLQFGGRPAFAVRLVLAATLAANYGIYGPAFELAEHEPREPGSEEYRDSEKYQVRDWDLDRPDSLRDFIARVNLIRRENPALLQDWNLRFHNISNDKLLCYSKSTEDRSDILVMVVNLDPFHRQSGWLELPLDFLGVQPDRPYQVHDLLSDARYLWDGARNYVEIDPATAPAHIFRLRRRVHREHDFDYYL